MRMERGQSNAVIASASEAIHSFFLLSHGLLRRKRSSQRLQDTLTHLVIAGLDPAIHPLSKESSCEDGWMPGSSPGMTSVLRGFTNFKRQTQLRILAA
jgi:hypothetical protein